MTAIPETELVTIVRRLIADLDPDEQLFTDDELGGFLDLNANNARLAAAEALETIAVSELLVSKRIRTQDLSTDGVAVSAELRALAERLRAAAASAEAEGFAEVVVPHRRRPEATEYEVWGL